MSTILEFKPWPKTPRLNKDIVITEKIDGTNAAVIVQQIEDDFHPTDREAIVEHDGARYVVGAQSRNRLIFPEQDNYGFAGWVRANKESLVRILGPGYHYGEWWGSGVTKANYGLAKGEKRFYLFNVHRYAAVAEQTELPELGLVKVLYVGPFSQKAIVDVLDDLRWNGSKVAPGYKAEGVIVYHTASGQIYKAFTENDDIPKGLVAAA